MKRILFSVVTVLALVFGGLLTSYAQAHGPHSYCGPRVGYYGGYGGYRAYYGRPVGAYYPRYVPYGAGYVGGYQPYQQFYYQRPGFGLYFGY
jgi:hypothetical protein